MRKKLLWIMLLSAVLVGCAGSGPDEDADRRGDAEQLEAAGVEQDARLLVWTGTGEEVGDSPGQLVLIDGRGTTEEVVELPEDTSRVQVCGEQATSPDGRYLALFTGANRGTLHLMDGSSAPEAVGEVNAMTCIGVNSLQFSPDSSRIGYIDFVDPTDQPYPSGELVIRTTADGESLLTLDNAVAFDLRDDSAAALGFFTNNRDEVTEAAVQQWTGGTPQELTTLFAEEGCEFDNGQIAYTGPEALAVLVGQTCQNGATDYEWLVYTVNLAAEVASLLLRGDAGGVYFVDARTSALFPAPNENALFITYPNGLALDTVNVNALATTNPEETAPLVRNGVMPRYRPNRAYDPSRNAAPVISADGRWLALVTNDLNDSAEVNVLDLNAPDLPPITFSAWDRGDTVSSMAFTPDSSRLVFVGGASDPGDNSLFVINLEDATDSRVLRGRFAANSIVVAPAGELIGAVTWQIPGDRQPNYHELEIINLGTNQATLLYRGAVIDADGTVTDQRFLVPLAWRA